MATTVNVSHSDVALENDRQLRDIEIMRRGMAQRIEERLDRAAADYVPFNTGVFAGGENPRTSSYCTASRERFFSGQVERSAPPKAPEARPWVVVDEGLREHTIAWALNQISAETEVTAFTHSGNARVRLPNGWEVSLNFGPGGYNTVSRWGWTSAFDYMERYRYQPEEWANQSPDAEVAIFQPSGAWFTPHESGPSEVFGYIRARDVMKVVDAVAQMPGGERIRPDGALTNCPCPDCVRERAVDRILA